MNKKSSVILSVLLILALCLSLAACGGTGGSAGKTAVIYTDKDEAAKAAYEASAKEYFSGCEIYDISALDSAATDARYIFMISADKSVLDRERVSGQNFTSLVYDSGSENLSVNMIFLMGDGDECVAQGSVVSGTAQASDTFDINAGGTDDPATRAEYIFKNIASEIKNIEG